MIRVTVWNEYLHEKCDKPVAEIYPNGIHATIADFLRCEDIRVRTATLEEPECELTKEVLGKTDVLIWWGHGAHAIAKGIGSYFELPHVETYGEPFGIPNPDEVIFIGWYEGGEVFRSGCTFHRENGRVFYFQPGHELYPIFHDKNVQTVIKNAVYWVAPRVRREAMKCWKLTRIEE